MTTNIIRNNDIICLEDLNTSNMLKNHKLAKSISDASFYEIRRQFEYKAKFYGRKIYYVDRYFPSSKMCSNCGYIKSDLKLSDRTYRCAECGHIIDRDLNAAHNIIRQALAELKHAENQKTNNLILTLIKVNDINYLDSMNRESKYN